jgi:hypothetical protein
LYKRILLTNKSSTIEGLCEGVVIVEDYKCVACGNEATEGFCIGRLCYYCIEETVVHFVKENKEKQSNARVGQHESEEEDC